MSVPAVLKKANKYPSHANLNPGNPAEIETYPATLPMEVALKTAPIKDICEAYGLSEEDWGRLKMDPMFVAEVAALRESLKKEGMSFKMKAQLQADELLNTAWSLIHAHNDDVAPNVKADLIKFVIKAAGLDASKEQAQQGPANALQININLG